MMSSLSQGFLSLSNLHLQNQFAALNVPKKDDSQIEGPSIANSYGFKVSMQNLQEAKALHEVSCAEETHENLKFMDVLLFCFSYLLFAPIKVEGLS